MYQQLIFTMQIKSQNEIWIFSGFSSRNTSGKSDLRKKITDQLKEFWDQESSWHYDWFQNFRQNTGEW